MFRNERDADGIITLTFDMPDRSQNVWNRDSLEALNAAIDTIAADAKCIGVVLTSGKKDFVAGADLKDLEAITQGGRSAEELYEGAGALSAVLRKLETCGKPFVAAINGTALGGGLELALACHYRIAADVHRIKIGLPEATLGLLPGGGGTQRLPRMIGVQASLPFLLEGKQLRPQKALQAGVVDAVVRANELIAACKAWVETSPSAVQPWDIKGFKVPGGGLEDAAIANVFMVANAMFAAKTYGNYPAGKAILSCLFEGLRLDIDSGLRIESRYFVELLLNPVAGAMIRTMFMSLGDANKLKRRPEATKRPPTKVGIIGAGLMGAGIAYSTAKAGISVVLLDRDQAAADQIARAPLLYRRLAAENRCSYQNEGYCCPDQQCQRDRKRCRLPLCRCFFHHPTTLHGWQV